MHNPNITAGLRKMARLLREAADAPDYPAELAFTLYGERRGLGNWASYHYYRLADRLRRRAR